MRLENLISVAIISDWLWFHRNGFFMYFFCLRRLLCLVFFLFSSIFLRVFRRFQKAKGFNNIYSIKFDNLFTHFIHIDDNSRKCNITMLLAMLRLYVIALLIRKYIFEFNYSACLTHIWTAFQCIATAFNFWIIAWFTTASF